MKKKLALIIISLDECFPKNGFSGGGHKVTKHLILGLIESGLFEIDIFCKKSSLEKIEGINSITVLSKKDFQTNLEQKLKEQIYDYVLSSDVLIPFANNIIHSNSSKYKSKNGKNPFMQLILGIYNAKKIKTQENNLPNDKAIFTVSESLKNDFVENFSLDAKKVFACIPAVDESPEFIAPELKDIFTIGSIAGGGLNKGGYLLLCALKRLSKTSKIKARIIFPKFHKSFFFQIMIKLLDLQSRVELLPKQTNMNSYYQSIDCYVLPSLNESFGLVVTEAASNSTPSVVSSTTGVSELIKDGENGFVFDRLKNPVRNLVQKLIDVSEIYFNNNEKYIQISKCAYETSKELSWDKFNNIIISNMIGENR